MIRAMIGVLRFCSLAPLLRGEGRGEGLFPRAQTRAEPPSPAALRASTSPRKRGEVKLRPHTIAVRIGVIVAALLACPSSHAQVETTDPGVVSGTLARIKKTGT